MLNRILQITNELDGSIFLFGARQTCTGLFLNIICSSFFAVPVPES